MTFVDIVHYRKEILSFEVVDLQGPYNALFGRLCYAMFMAVPNYAYLKLKMLGPYNVITVSGNFQSAYQCERDVVEYAEVNNLDSGAPSFPCSRTGKKLLPTALGQQPTTTLDLSSSTPPSAPTLAVLAVGS
jgi:hypothetical protein